MTAVEGPDFICIGMPKAGTGWLYDQLRFHPEFWMSPVKELGYLARANPSLKGARKLLERGRANAERFRTKARANRPKWEDRDFAFLDDVVALAEQERDIARYAAVFRHKGALKSGDITPGYALMTPDDIKEVAEKLPHVKVIFLIREPIARLWSHINHYYNDDKFDAALLEDAAAFADFLDDHPRLWDLSKPTQILARWKECAPSLAFRHYFFDELAEHPKRTRHKILRFLDADPKAASPYLPEGYNRKKGKAKLVMPDAIKSFLRDRLADEIRTCASVLGKSAGDWPARYGL